MNVTRVRSISDSELRRKLRRAGLDYDRTERVIQNREDPGVAEALDELFGVGS